MMQISPSEFLQKVENGTIKEVFAIGQKVYGTDYSYSFDRAQNGKICELVFAVVP